MYAAENGKAEAKWAVDTIKMMVKSGEYQPQDCAILFRKHVQGRLFEQAMVRLFMLSLLQMKNGIQGGSARQIPQEELMQQALTVQQSVHLYTFRACTRVGPHPPCHSFFGNGHVLEHCSSFVV